MLLHVHVLFRQPMPAKRPENDPIFPATRHNLPQRLQMLNITAGLTDGAMEDIFCSNAESLFGVCSCR
ncbi:MAG: hypothetical protein RLZZ458_498 [Planctomycetota bacterium]